MSLTVHQDKENNFMLEHVQEVDETQVLHCKQRNFAEIRPTLKWGITLGYKHFRLPTMHNFSHLGSAMYLTCKNYLLNRG